MICMVSGPNGKRLVRAKSNKAAIDYVVGQDFSSRSVSAEEVVDLMADGMHVEDAADVEIEVQEQSSEAQDEAYSDYIVRPSEAVEGE